MENNLFNKIVRSPFFFGVLLIIFAFSAWSLVNELARRQKIQQQIDLEQAEIRRLTRENQDLSELIDSLRSSGYVEEQARSKFNLSKPGESLIVVENPPTDPAGAKQTANWQKWWDYFFHD